MKKPKTLKPIRPNVGIEVAYQKKIDSLLEEMEASVTWWLRSAYRANSPEMAADASPAKALQKAIAALADRWLKRFDAEAPNLAKWFAGAVQGRSDSAMTAALKDAGLSVKFVMTRKANDVYQAVLGENVSLIKSIPSQFFSEIEGMVLRSVSVGRDLGSLTKDLEDRYGVTRRRAAFISRDQNNKATAVITRVRQQELGITEAIWTHSTAGKHPRPAHVAASGKRYNVAEGMLIEGKYIWPGTEINCRCIARSVVPGF